MNKARQLYLIMNFNIDCIDNLIHKANMTYHNCKLWNSHMTHAKALDVVVSYDMYLECGEGELNESWNIREPMILWEFREKIFG